MMLAIDQLVAARTERIAMDRLDVRSRPADERAAYDLQARLHERLVGAGLGSVAGYKIGCTSQVMQRYLRIPNPCAGGVLGPSVRNIEGTFAHGDFLRVGVECELAVTLSSDVTPDDAPHDREGMARRIEALMCAIEVVDDRWQDYRMVDTPSLIADDFFAAGCVLGEPRRDWQKLGLDTLAGSMKVNGEVVGEGQGRDILGDPLAALVWLADLRVARGESLLRGEFVLLGSMVQTRWLAPGDEVEVSVRGLGSARATFTA